MNDGMKEYIKRLTTDHIERIQAVHLAQANDVLDRYLTNQTPFFLPLANDIEKLDFSRKTVTIMKSVSCGATFSGIDIQRDYFYPSIENIERDIKKRSLPDYVKKSLHEARL